MTQSSQIYTGASLVCHDFRKLWTLPEAEAAVKLNLGCEISTEVHKSDMEDFMPYGIGGSTVVFTTKGMTSWNQEAIECAARAVEDLSMCEVEAYSTGLRKIMVYKTPERTELRLMMPEQLAQIIASDKAAWDLAHGDAQ